MENKLGGLNQEVKEKIYVNFWLPERFLLGEPIF